MALGFGPSPGTIANGVQLPDGPAYFCSRGSALGQVRASWSPPPSPCSTRRSVVPAVATGWGLTDAPTIAAARVRGATAQLARILGDAPAGLVAVTDLLVRHRSAPGRGPSPVRGAAVVGAAR